MRDSNFPRFDGDAISLNAPTPARIPECNRRDREMPSSFAAVQYGVTAAVIGEEVHTFILSSATICRREGRIRTEGLEG